MALHIHNTDNVTDDATLELVSPLGVTTAVVGGTTYLFVTGGNDDGVSVFSVAADGTLTNVDNVSDDATLELDGAVGVTTAVVGGTTYLFVTGDRRRRGERVRGGGRRDAQQRGQRGRWR